MCNITHKSATFCSTMPLTTWKHYVIIRNRIVTFLERNCNQKGYVCMTPSKRLVRLTALLLSVCLCVFPVHAQENDQPTETTETVEEQTAQLQDRAVSVVHYSPDYSSLVIGCLENGTRITVLGTTQAFYKIDCYGITGYLARTQVQQSADGEYVVDCTEDSAETYHFNTYTPEEALAIRSQIRTLALKYLGVRYVSGGTSPYGFDCSGLTQYVFAQMGIPLYRTVFGQLANGVAIAKEDLQCGDLVVFQNTTGAGHFASHVGIYIGNGQVVHSGTGGVGVANLSDAYFTYHYQSAVRVVLSGVEQEQPVPSIGINRNMNSSYWRESSQTDVSGNFFCFGT